MPMPFEDAVITNGGIELLTKAQAGECKIAFTRMAIGNGEYTDAEKTTDALQQMTNLKKLQNSYSMASVSVSGKTTVKLTALLTNEDPATGAALITEGYYINEIGVFAKEAGGADSTEVLYSIAVTSDGQGDFMPAYNGSNPAQITQYYYATVDNSEAVTIEVVNDEFVLKEDYDTEIADLKAEITQLKSDLTELDDDLSGLLNIAVPDGDTYALRTIALRDSSYSSRVELVKAKFSSLELNSIYIAVVSLGGISVAIIQTFSDYNYGSVLMFGYFESTPVYLVLNNGTWSQKTLSAT